MSTDADILTWDERIDHCLGRAAVVLANAESMVESVSEAGKLARYWQFLAYSWQDRQRHAAGLNEAMAGLDFADEEDIAEGAPHDGMSRG